MDARIVAESKVVGEVNGVKIYYHPETHRHLFTLGEPVNLMARIDPKSPRTSSGEYHWTVVVLDEEGCEIGNVRSGYRPSDDPDAEDGGAWYHRHAAEASPAQFARPVYVHTDRKTISSEKYSLYESGPGCPPSIGVVTGEDALRIIEAYNEIHRPIMEKAAAEEAAFQRRKTEWTEAKEIALLAATRVPAGTRKDAFLPFVRAALGHFDAAQDAALHYDDTATSFSVANEQLAYREAFKKLTGREYDAVADKITRAEIEVLPVSPPSPPHPVVYECLECGATYPPEQAHLIDAGGMGCARCNH